MDDINNNTGIGDTQNPNPSQNSNDYNSMQPVSDLVNNLSGMPDVEDDNKPVEVFPNQTASNPIMENTIPPLDTVQPTVASSIPDLGVFNTNTPQTPVMDTTTPVTSPTVETPMSTPSPDAVAVGNPPETQAPTDTLPTADTPMFTPSPDAVALEESTEAQIPTDTLPTMGTSMPMPSSDNTMTSEMSSQDKPVEQFSTPVEAPMPAFNDTEVVDTLTNENTEKDKGGTTIVIVLIVVIVLLLITIGYFAYKIFFS